MYRTYLRKSFEITGNVVFLNYGEQSRILCNECFPEEFEELKQHYHTVENHPIFLSDEFDYTPTCDIYLDTIDVNLIEYNKPRKKVSLNVSL